VIRVGELERHHDSHRSRADDHDLGRERRTVGYIRCSPDHRAATRTIAFRSSAKHRAKAAIWLDGDPERMADSGTASVCA
jgi:hypothetical protein